MGQTTALKPTPLLSRHEQLQARMAGFGGWLMPIQYIGITHEHQAVRQRAGLFDISHMGKFRLQGAQVLDPLQRLVPSDLSTLQAGQAKYTVLLNEQGGILDDLIIYSHSATEATLIVNAATTPKDWHWLKPRLEAASLTLTDESEQWILLALQGPEAIALLQQLSPDPLDALPYYGHRHTTILDQPAWIARTGYTGEDGVEIMVAPAAGQALWDQLLTLGVTPCGLGARDTLRLEAAMPLYGQDIDESTTPLEAGLSWLVNLDKPDFVGRSALLQQKQTGLTRRLVGLAMQGRHIARHGHEIQAEGQTIGIITSGSFAPTLGQAIALAYLPPALAQVGQTVDILIRGKRCPAQVVKRPFYRRPKA